VKDGSPHAGLSALESRFDSRKAVDFFDRHARHEALRRGLAGVANYLAGLSRPTPVYEPNPQEGRQG
jgi:hypothetical protein